MEKSIITFSANEQNLQKTGGIGCYASDTVSYIEARFALGENWSGYDSIRAVWFNDYKTISTVLDSDGVCIVPHEVLVNRGKVMVNLVGSVLVSDELTDRLTTFPCEALKVSAKAKISGSETAAVTPSQFEQFVSIVISEVEKVTGMTAQAETLPAGSQATAHYENGILYLGIPQGIRGERGETGADGADGNGIASVVYNADYSLTLVFDNGERFTTPPIRGERGPAGADGRDGTDGADGLTPNISIGNVETLEPSEDAYVTRRGTDANPIFDFGIPKGDTGTVPDLDLILPTDTASGDIASITDGQNVVPVKSLKVTLEPIQSGSGTPSPSNVRPISGHTECVTGVCGVNVFDSDTMVEDGVYIANNAGVAVSSSVSTSTTYISVVPNASYYIKSKQTGGAWGAWYDANKNYISGITAYYDGATDALKTKTAPSNAKYMRLTLEYNGTGDISTASINYPSTDHEYHAYDGQSYTTTLGRTVYGGTLDVVTGELVVDRAMVDLGTLDWVYESARDLFEALLVPRAKSLFDAVCSNYQFVGSYSVMTDKTCGYIYGYHVAIKDSTYGSDTIAFKTAMNGVQLCYELATPQTYQLDPQTISLLHGNNNVWSDGEVELTYNADVGLYIDKKLGASGTTSLSMTRALAKSEDTDDKSEETETKSELTKSDNIQLAED